MQIFIFFLSLTFFGCSTFTKREPSPEFAKWASHKTPTSGESQIFGTYQAGCIAGAQALSFDGTGYFVVHKSHARYYGHPTMIAYLSDLGKKMDRNLYPKIAIEDISYPRGGPFLTGHSSHQVGLDVDISLVGAKSIPSMAESENWASPSFVHDRKILLPTWGKEQTQLVELAASAPEVNRIFVAPAIKKYFCENKANAPWLYKLRSWWGHDDHIHVRLNCPATSPDCKSQAPLDTLKNSCGAELDWWYSAEADAEAKKQDVDTSVRDFPALPANCENLKAAN